MQRLGKNLSGYRGEKIDIQLILERIKIAAIENNWHSDFFTISNGAQLIAYRRKGFDGDNSSPKKRLYLSTGIHGDEPAGPVAILKLILQNQWPPNLDVWLCPCLNLTGFPLNTRENEKGIDLNRDYRHLQSDEVRAHIAWLKEQPSFDVSLCLHEDWEANGFYVYELNPDNRPSLAQKIIQNVAGVCPIENAETVDGWPIQNGVIRPQIDPMERPQWPESLFLITNKTRQSYTLESPSDFPIEVRVTAQMTAVRTVLDSIAEKN